MTEIEVKILEIEAGKVQQRLKDLNAPCTFSGEMHALFFDFADGRIREAGDALRLRKEGDKVVLAYKKRISKKEVKVMEEHETPVGDLNTMRTIFAQLGLQAFSETRKFRTEYHLGAASIVIDEYRDALDHIPTFLEIEAPDVTTLNEVVRKLGFAVEDCKSWDTYDLMQYYSPSNP